MIEYDCETTGLQPYSGTQRAFMHIFYDGQNAEAIHADSPGARTRIQGWFDRAKQDKEGIRAWNFKFDKAWAEQEGYSVPGDGCWHDGMVVAHAIDERRSVALKSVAKELFGEDADADQKSVKGWLTEERRRRAKEAKANKTEIEEPNYGDVPLEIMTPYALEDVILTRKIGDQYESVIENTPDIKRLVEFERKAGDALYAVEKRGLPAEEQSYRRLEQEVIDNLEHLEETVIDLAREGDPKVFYKTLDKLDDLDDENPDIRDFNFKSTAQIIAALKARGADMRFMSQKNGKLSADAENLRAVDDELAAAVLDLRSEYKVLSTYVRPMIGRHYESSMRLWKEPFITPDGRIHANYRQVGARTGRMCISAGTLIDGPRNLITHPKGVRIEDINVGDFVYSHGSDGVPRPQRVLRTFKQGRKRVLKLVWRASGNKSYLGELKATPCHRVRLQTGAYKRMDELSPGDQLAFLSRGATSDGYAWIGWQHGSGDGVRSSVDEHRHIGPSAEIVHHIDENKLNNSLDNLEGMAVQQHNKHHNPCGPRPGRNKPCPYTTPQLDSMLSFGVRYAAHNHGHDHRTLKRWAAERSISVPDMRRPEGAPLNHVVVAVVDEGEACETYDLEVENTHAFVANEIAVHNSCSDPNMQNQPRDDLRLRYNIAAEPGHKLVACDLSNVEMMLFAAYAGEGKLLNAARNGDDQHALTAKMLALRDRVRPGGSVETARQLGKRYNFSRVYGGGLTTIKRQFRCSMDEARLYKRRFDEAYPEVVRLQDRIYYRLAEVGYIQDRLISGRRFRVDPREAYKATNYLVQGTAASLLKYALIKLHEDGVPVVALIHDEIVAHVPEKDAREVAQLIEKRMTEHEGLREIVPLRAEADIIDRWSDAKPLKDESRNNAPYLFTPKWAGSEKRYLKEGS